MAIWEAKYIELRDLLDSYQSQDAVTIADLSAAASLLDDMFAAFVSERDSIERSELISKEQEILSQIQRFRHGIKGATPLITEADTYAATRAFSVGTKPYVVVVRGRTSFMDGGEGVFIADINGGTDDDGVVLASSDGKAFRRIYSGAVQAKWYGVTADGVADDTTAFANACQGAGGGALQLPRGGLINLHSDVTGFQERAVNITVNDLEIIGAGCTIRSHVVDPGYNLIWVTGNRFKARDVIWDHRTASQNTNTGNVTLRLYGTDARLVDSEFRNSGSAAIVDASGIPVSGENFPNPATVTNTGTVIDRCKFVSHNATCIITKSGGNAYARYTNLEFDDCAWCIKLDGERVPTDGSFGRQVIIDNIVIHDCDAVRNGATGVSHQGLLQVEEGFEDVLITNVTARNVKNTSASPGTLGTMFRINTSSQTNQPISRVHISGISATDFDGHFSRFIANEPLAWDSGTTYSIDDRVVDGGIAYKCILGHSNQQPPNGTYWILAGDGSPPQYGVGTELADIQFEGIVLDSIASNNVLFENPFGATGIIRRVSFKNVKRRNCALFAEPNDAVREFVLEGMEDYDATSGVLKFSGNTGSGFLRSIRNVTSDNSGDDAIRSIAGTSARIVLENIEVSRSAGVGIWFEATDDITGRNLTLVSNGEHGALFSNCNRLTLDGIVARDNGQSSAVPGVSIVNVSSGNYVVNVNSYCVGGSPTQTYGVFAGNSVTASVFSNIRGDNNISGAISKGTGSGNEWADDELILDVQTLPDGDTTPSVQGYTYFKTANTGATVVTTFDGGVAGKLIYVQITDANTTLQNGATIVTISGADLTAQGLYAFLYDGAAWREVGRLS